MTHIVSSVTKKELKLAVSFLNEIEPLLGAGFDIPANFKIWFEDPSVFPGAWSGYLHQMKPGTKLTCTNHPKRSWFALVERTADGRWRVS